MQTGKFANLIGRSGPNLVMAAGVVCLLVALFFPVPGDHLTTYKSLSNESGYSYIEEYVGGDAYNYITGASLVGGHIAGAMAAKSIFAVGGLILLAMGIGQANAQRTEQQSEAAGKHAEGGVPKEPTSYQGKHGADAAPAEPAAASQPTSPNESNSSSACNAGADKRSDDSAADQNTQVID